VKRMPCCPKVPGAYLAAGDSAAASGRCTDRGDSRWAGVDRSPLCFCVRWRLQIAMAALVALPPERRSFTSNNHTHSIYKQCRNQVIFHVSPLTPP